MSFDVVKAALAYFGIVFGAGFVLGPIRILWAVPRFGIRAAELMEAPLMLVVVILAARWVARRFGSELSSSSLLGAGVLALSLMLAAELTLVLWLQGMSFTDYVANRDPVSGTVYLVMLGIFAVMPWLASRFATSAE